jgi:F-type H+-transporting ATPase subunit gamma
MAEESEPPLLYVFGQKGIAFCKEKGFSFESFSLPDVPTYADAEGLTKKMFDLYTAGEVDRIYVIHQHFINMMVQKPAAELILPYQQEENGAAQEILFLPDRETAVQSPSMYCLTNKVYHILLGHCAGIQASTTIAMRSACDNAEKSLEKLETLINRIRQAEVTNSVIETSSYLISEE